MSWPKSVLVAVILILAIIAWMGRYQITNGGEHNVYRLDRWTGELSYISYANINVVNQIEMSSEEIKMLVDKKQPVYEQSELLEKFRQQFPQYNHYDDSQFAAIVAQRTEKPYDEVAAKFGLQSIEPSKFNQLRAGNPAYNSYSDKQFIRLIANKINISPEELEKRIGYK